MTKLIRVKDKTYEELTKQATWEDTMDKIIARLLRIQGIMEVMVLHDREIFAGTRANYRVCHQMFGKVSPQRILCGLVDW
jgi:hypothetical protein